MVTWDAYLHGRVCVSVSLNQSPKGCRTCPLHPPLSSPTRNDVQVRLHLESVGVPTDGITQRGQKRGRSVTRRGGTSCLCLYCVAVSCVCVCPCVAGKVCVCVCLYCVCTSQCACMCICMLWMVYCAVGAPSRAGGLRLTEGKRNGRCVGGWRGMASPTD